MGLRAALRSRINKFLREGETDTELGPKGDRTNYFQTPWVRFYQRKATWNDLQKMDKDEPIVARGLDTITRYSTQFSDGRPQIGFVLEGGDRELAALESLTSRLQPRAFEHVRYMVHFGDLFGEVVVGEDRLISDVKMFPYSYQVEKNTDDKGNLLNGDPEEAMKHHQRGLAAYDQVNDHGELVAAFHPYQIAQFSFGNKQGLKYTDPHLGCAIVTVKRLRAIKDGITIARLIGAYPPRKHHVPIPEGTSEADTAKKIKQYRDAMTKDTTIPYDTASADFVVGSRESPPAVETTFFLPRLYTADGARIIDGDVETLSANNPNLSNLEDVHLHLRELLCAIGVPADFLNLGVGQRAFIDKTTPEKREAFLYLCCAVKMAYRTTIRYLCELQLLLSGINPLTADFEVVTPRISPREAEVAANIDLKRANTAIIWAKLGIPKEVTATRVLQMTPAEANLWIKSGGTVAPEGKDPEKQVEEWSQYARETMALPEGTGIRV